MGLYDELKTAANTRAFCDAHLTAAPRSGRGHYVCPVCGSGSSGRPNSDADFHIDDTNPLHLKCFACGWSGDIFDLAGVICGTDNKTEQANAVAEEFGVSGFHGDGRGTSYEWRGTGTTSDGPTTGTVTANDTSQGETQADYTEGRTRHREYIRQTQANIGAREAVEYLTSRGIDPETAKAWGLGYDPTAGGAKDPEGNWCRRGRIVIPWAGSDYYHIDRSIDPTAKEHKYHKPDTSEVGPQPLWNPAALKAKAFFVVEGALDALAVQACGYEAVAMGTSNNARDLTAAMKATEGVGLALLLNDNDETGAREQAKMVAALEAAGLAYATVDATTLGTKDAFEMYGTARDELAAILEGTYRHATEEKKADKLKGLGVYDTTDVMTDLYTMDTVLAPIPTGLSRIDGAIGGGLPARGLVVIGAVSSAGKTTLVHQICDNIAATGRPVLFVSVEQGRQELVAKSLSRIMATMGREHGGRIMASAQAITNRAERERWLAEDIEKHQAFTQACNLYNQRTHLEDGRPTIYIMEPEKRPTVAQIREAAEAIREEHGQPPVVAVDYVQLLGAPAGLERGTDKQILDENTSDLRQMARDMPTCVVAISSLNRASYTGCIDLSSFKESGMLEYSSDLLLGVQPYGLEDAMRGKNEESGPAKAKARQIMREYKEAQEKQVEVVILKNRNGGISKSPFLTFDGMTSTFSEKTPPKKKAQPAQL